MKKNTVPKIETLLMKLSPEIQAQLAALPLTLWESVQEIRLQEGKPPYLVLPGKVALLEELCDQPISEPVTREMLEHSFAALCEYSVHTYLPQIQNGFITVTGGHRIGLGGTAVLHEGKIISLRQISSMNIRLARENTAEIREAAQTLFGQGLCSVLIAGEPSSGKTTILRSLALWLSGVQNEERHRVAVVDERGEIIDEAAYKDSGCLDVLKGFPKSVGILQAVRTLSPQVVVCDEIGDGQETDQMIEAINCGVFILATIHAASCEELQKRPQFQKLQSVGAFQKLVLLEGAKYPAQIKAAYRFIDGKPVLL